MSALYSDNPATPGPAGSVITTTIQSTNFITPTVTPSPRSNNISTVQIVGGVVGAVGSLTASIIIIIIFWYRPRRRRRREEPRRNSDHHRVVRGSDLPDIASAVATPFQYDPRASSISGPTSPTFSDGSMRQYRDSQALLGGFGGAGAATGTSGSHYAASTSSDGASAPPGSSIHARSLSHGSAGLAPGSPVGQPLQPFRPQYARQPEASRRKGGGLGLASAPEQGQGIIEGNVEGIIESRVIQHEDGGRVAESEPVPPSAPQEIPPRYESIPGNV